VHQFRKLLTHEQIFTIPNFMSLFRLVLVPFIIWTYWKDAYDIAAAMVLVSALTDIFDGMIARKFNMVSDLGKILDPISDKVTQAALMVCLASRYSFVWFVFALLAVKELTMFALGTIAIKRRNTVHSAKWYGKFCTAVLETCMFLLILFPGIPANVTVIMLLLCCAVMLFSFAMYFCFFVSQIRGEK